MSIMFKFKSSNEYETLDFGRKLYISIGEVRSKIMSVKKLNTMFRMDSDLVLIHAVTGQEYGDDAVEIQSGSSLIVKRVPSKGASSVMLGFQRLRTSHPREDILKGLDQINPRKNVGHENHIPDSHKLINLKNFASASYKGLQSACSSSLKCPVCTKYFKEAMTIQCCSHTFCDECIRFELIIKGECPMCRSTECGVDDLIPNVSLNETVKRILEPELVVDAGKNDLPNYASDGGSGIEGNNISYAVPVTKRNKGLFHYTSAEDQGSNLDNVEYAYTSHNGKAPITTAAKSQDINQPLIMPQDNMPLQAEDQGSNLDNVEYAYTSHNGKAPITTAAKSQDINQPLIMPQDNMPLQGGDGPFAVGSTNKKEDFTCYTCGSPDHLISHCPIAHAEWVLGEPMFPGVPCFTAPYWVGAPAPEVNSHMNMCGSLGVVPFGGSMIPVEPYSDTDYLPSLFNSSPVPGQCSIDYENSVANKPPFEDLVNRKGQPGSSSSMIHHEAEKELGGIRTVGSDVDHGKKPV